MTAKWFDTVEEFLAQPGMAERVAGWSEAERERFRAHMAEQAMKDIRAELLDLGWKLLKIMHGRIQPRA